MSFSNYTEEAILDLIFNGTAWANVADNAASSPATNLYLSLHTSDPGEAGTQTTSEAAYTSYARVAVARSGSGWTVSGNTATLAATAEFPAATGGTETLTHFGVGFSASGAGELIGSAQLLDDNGDPASIAVTTGVAPRMTTGTTVTLD